MAAVHSVPVKNFFYGTGTEEYVYRYVLDVRSGVIEAKKGSQYEVMADVHIRPGDFLVRNLNCSSEVTYQPLFNRSHWKWYVCVSG